MLDALLGEARERWGLDAAAGLQVIPAERLVEVPLEPSRPALIVPLAVLGGDPPVAAQAPLPLPGRHAPAGREPLSLLARLYPESHQVARLGGGGAVTVGRLQLNDLSTPLYVPPIAPELAAAGPWAMPYVSNRLRQPDGCPWDREQTHASLRGHLLEEAYEVYDALEQGATPQLAEELGDLLLQVVLHSQLAAEAGVFDLADVQASIARKIVRRHPHVFGDAEARTAADVNRQWERIKARERADAAAAAVDEGVLEDRRPKGALDGISRSLPALAASQEMQARAAALGYDWPDLGGVLDKVAEELGELERSVSAEERHEEFGDLLLVLVNVGRKLGIEAEAALRAANDKFRDRFGRVERMAAERGVALRDLDFAALDELWHAAKAEARRQDDAVAAAAGLAGEAR